MDRARKGPNHNPVLSNVALHKMTIRGFANPRRYRAPMSDLRHCARPGCGGAAAAWLTYDYASRTVWLDHPGDGPEGAWGMCATHAETLTVPVGWALTDRRRQVIELRPQIAV